ncbi:hypothetical protein ACUXAV_000358 [Cupriavidus metallidurans]|nr:hypothetical protein [Cupriavidus metallidurans]MDE4918318.1 hypothetical protein [Cupriavidus metallidurans]
MPSLRKFRVVIDNKTEYIAVAQCSVDVVIQALEKGATKIKVTSI